MVSDEEAQPEAISDEAMQRLRVVQDLDDELRELEAETRRRPSYLKKKQRAVDAARAAADEVKSNLTTLQKLVDSRTVESESIRTHIQKLEGQLFALKSNTEFEAMKGQIANKQKEDDALQDKILEGMMAVDQLREKQTEALAEVEKKEGEFEKAEGQVASELAAVETKLAETKSRRADAFAELEADLAALYDDVATRREGIAVAALIDQICKGCDTEVTMQVLNSVYARRLSQCPRCDRILYPATS